jgi:hypothetical protein
MNPIIYIPIILETDDLYPHKSSEFIIGDITHLLPVL